MTQTYFTDALFVNFDPLGWFTRNIVSYRFRNFALIVEMNLITITQTADKLFIAQKSTI